MSFTGDVDATENWITFGTGSDADIEATTDFSMTVDGADLGIWKVTTGTLTPTQVRKLFATPVQVIAAPGSGLAIIIESIRYQLDFASVAYDSVGAGEDFEVSYGDNGQTIGGHCDNSTCLNADGGADTWGYVEGGSGSGEAYDPRDNSNIEIFVLLGELAAADMDANGDSPIHYLIRYRVVTLDLS